MFVKFSSVILEMKYQQRYIQSLSTQTNTHKKTQIKALDLI